MIIGAIIEVTDGNWSSGNRNGTALLHFYTLQEAILWAELQSENSPVSTNANMCVCTVINTDNGLKRWWFNGTEYTG